MAAQRVTLTFDGGALASFGRTFLYGFLTACVIPAAWGAVSLTRWWTENTRLADGSRLSFHGRASQVWFLFAVLAFLEFFLPQFARRGVPPDRGMAMLLVVTVLLLPLVAAVKLPLYRWIVANLQVASCGYARLTAPYGGYLGWLVIVNAAMFTFVLWPWALTAMLRWLCGHVRGQGFTFEFTGTGLGLLGRSLVWLVCSLLIIPIPWVMRSTYRWFTENLVLVREGMDAEILGGGE
jgi:hypothetical protein